MTEFIIVQLVGFLAQFILQPLRAAKYSKYLLKARDWLNLLFPLELYPKGAAFENGEILPKGMTKDKVAVPLGAVKEASKTKGFNIPFIKGM